VQKKQEASPQRPPYQATRPGHEPAGAVALGRGRRHRDLQAVFAVLILGGRNCAGSQGNDEGQSDRGLRENVQISC
jgi:hypothetical protein